MAGQWLLLCLWTAGAWVVVAEFEVNRCAVKCNEGSKTKTHRNPAGGSL